MRSFTAVEKSRIGSALLALALLSGMPAVIADTPALKADTPKLAPIEQPRKPLQAGLQHNESFKSQKPKTLSGKAQGLEMFSAGKLRSGAQMANTNPLKSRLNDNSLNAGATSGFGIIGVKFVLTLGQAPVINRVFEGTPASKTGIHINDVIVAVDGVPTLGLTKEEVYDLIIGSPGTPVTVSIMQPSGDFRVVNCTRMDVNEISDPRVRRDYLISM